MEGYTPLRNFSQTGLSSQESPWIVNASMLKSQSHKPSLFTPGYTGSAFMSVGQSSQSLPLRLPYCDEDVEELGDAASDALLDSPSSLNARSGPLLTKVKEEEAGLGKKRGRAAKDAVKSKIPKSLTKTKKMKTSAQENERESDSEDEEKNCIKWKDCEVETLIAIRGEMEEAFSRSAKKQGQNAWIKLQTRMISALRGFNRSWLSCKKKYKTILTAFRNDKRANEISGNDRHQECRWFEQMDFWHGSRASVKNQIPASAQECCENISNTCNASSGLVSELKKKKTNAEKMEGFLEQVIDNSKNLVASFQATTELLKRMDAHMAALVQKL